MVNYHLVMSFLSDLEVVAKALDEACQQSRTGAVRVINQEPMEKIIAELKLENYTHQGGLRDGELRGFVDRYLRVATKLHHPAYMAHQVATPYYSGSLGSLIDGITNNAMAIYEMGPGAASIEYFVINWLLEKIGWEKAPGNRAMDCSGKPCGGGVLTHGGSLANLTAMLAAMRQAAPQAWNDGVPPNLVLLAPAGAHYSIARAAGILGIGQKAICHLEVDRQGAIIPERLAATLRRVRDQGKRVLAVTANACSTAVGIYDPLAEVGALCREHDLWLHIDGAHGASALLSHKYRRQLTGIELADSVTWDAHKMMQSPLLCAALLVRDHRTLDAAFEQDASYLFHDKERPGIDFAHRTVECTKAGLGLKFFMVLGALGESGLGAFIDQQYELAAEAYDYIAQQPDFECAVRPQSNIICFRIQGSDEHQIEIRNTLLTEGQFYISSTLFNGKRYLRLALMSPATNRKTIEALIARIRALSRRTS